MRKAADARRQHWKARGQAKNGHATEEYALAAAQRMSEKHGTEFQPYLCPCGKWHIGNPMKRTERPYLEYLEIELGRRAMAHYLGYADNRNLHPKKGEAVSSPEQRG